MNTPHFDELHITPDGAHFVECTERVTCGEGCCSERDCSVVQCIDGLTSEAFVFISDDLSAAVVPADVKTSEFFSCGCPVWWTLITDAVTLIDCIACNQEETD